MVLTFPWRKLQSYLAEMAATFIFIFVVYSAVLTASMDELNGGPILEGLSVGFVTAAIIYSFVDITIAHFNPAITFAAICLGKLPIVTGITYIIFQLLGSMIACAVVLGCFPQPVSDILDIIRPSGVDSEVTTGEIMCTELFLSAILTFVAFAVAVNPYKSPKYEDPEAEQLLSRPEDIKPDRSPFAPLVIGLIILVLALVGASTSGGAFNPAIVWSPVLFSGVWNDSWKYWIAEFVGGVAGGAVQVLILSRS
ncbi:Aquaporin-like protein [Spraguea lophii 42_110]|uniref:Aquaporin n=1 Tax=Spraguea lophii (strain 42_110) TaxID=1358809 RepID=S7WA93_SPRLO|nr:Aquaporin-like protein [Spraguea lophii 42_110]